MLLIDADIVADYLIFAFLSDCAVSFLIVYLRPLLASFVRLRFHFSLIFVKGGVLKA
jgi:hypothetical protein